MYGLRMRGVVGVTGSKPPKLNRLLQMLIYIEYFFQGHNGSVTAKKGYFAYIICILYALQYYMYIIIV
jgi:hypothetical protein